MRSLPPAFISPSGMKALDLKIQCRLSPFETGKTESLTRMCVGVDGSRAPARRYFVSIGGSVLPVESRQSSYQSPAQRWPRTQGLFRATLWPKHRVALWLAQHSQLNRQHWPAASIASFPLCARLLELPFGTCP